jgi:peptide/nickel transport system substrate-binding protein
MMPRSLHRVPLASLLLLALAIAGCGRSRAPSAPVVRTWVAGRPEPPFDPGGPPEPVRWALERLLSRGLCEEDSSGRVVAAAGSRVDVSRDGRVVTFHLADGLAFADGSPCTSADFSSALERSLARRDHGTQAWLLAALEGMDRLRAGRPLPRLGIETPDRRTLVLRLARPESMLLRALALPGVAAPWRDAHGAAAGWSAAVGLGPYRVVREEPGRRLVLAKVGGGAGVPDSIVVRFVPGAARVLQLLRGGAPDLLWPLPSGFRRAGLPAGYRELMRPAHPARRLLLVLRADLPPTLMLPARHALVHGLNHEELMRVLGARAVPPAPWFDGAPPVDMPSLDEAAAHAWMERARLGRSFHVRMAYDADGPGSEIARVLQGQWARLGVYVELEPLRGAELARQMLTGNAHLVLAVDQPLFAGPGATLASLVMPLRGPAVGPFRTGWRAREFDAARGPGGAAAVPDPGLVARRLDEERVALPLAGLSWDWVERPQEGAVAFHPRFGPECAHQAAGVAPAR